MTERHIYRAKRASGDAWVIGHLTEIYLALPEVREKAILDIREMNFSCATKRIDLKTLGQCLGIRDKAAVFIHEGDILERELLGNRTVRGVVVWNDMGFTGFMLRVKESGGVTKYYPIGRGQFDDDTRDICNDVIVGNIHDNPGMI